ncbi:pantetheine-phosphate adenylyltransferase [Acetohalobium arabaticum]|uniref:Phosphopantetheine adenylyltransferase n=1 Tax=Acetohalobium arabaticum (strain ATCC 49924 / DSM 5501 / Z-7288) TaxID=574087 RepID=D9QQY6_ACEAZ|nr:pantetheine-phosphate adenylyltransferase [Acetohalobium arabaticum]ADL12927.1 Phosphopantetheine adenylyltransferase [Acetohalobium arabaticum DSM 5501]
MGRAAVYPGSFDPITNGHLDIIERTANIFDNVIVAVSNNPNKDHLFSREERVQMIEEAIVDYEEIEVDAFDGLLIDYIREQKAEIIVRGLRAVSDFEAEFQMASMNKKLDSDIETIFMMTKNQYVYLSSSIIREVSELGGCIEGLVPENVIPKLREKIGGE